MSKFIHRIDRILTGAVNVALVTLFVVMMSLAFVQVFLRSFFSTSILWGDIAARQLVIWVGMLGAVLATRENKHFRIDILTRFLSKRQQSWFQSFSNLVASVVCCLLGRASVTFLGLDADSTTFLNIPVDVVELIIPIGFYLMTVQFLLRAVINAMEGSGNLPSSAQPEA